MNVVDLLADAADSKGRIVFTADGLETTPTETWRRSTDVADWLTRRTETGQAVASVLTPSLGCLATIIGAWRSGVELVSLPQPGRGMSLDAYKAQVEAMCELTGATILMVDARYLPLIPEMPVEVLAFDAALAGAPPGRRDVAGSFVQFTSGTTGNPKGVRLSLDAIGANVEALLEVLDPQPDDVVVSWLPLSHDMGLVGMLLAPLAGAAPRWAGSGSLYLMPPEGFVRQPASWMRTCSETGATITAGPNFALDLTSRVLETHDQLDLSRLRTFITGAETVRAATLGRLVETGRRHGFDERALCPAYGLAEATLAVTLVRPDESWQAEAVDMAPLYEGRWVSTADTGGELVSSGHALPGVEIRIAGSDDVGEVQVRSPALLDAYVGGDDPLIDGWLPTGDLGAVRECGLFLAARLDDRMSVGGRNLFATELEAAIGAHPGVRAGSCVAIPDEGGRYVVVAEPAQATELEKVASEIRSLLARQYTAPSAVHFVARGSLPKTPSGKPQRHRVSGGLRAGSLAVELAVDFSARRWGSAT